LRAVANLEILGERTIRIDCDVIQADGGTRTASITGSMIALYQICNFLGKKNMLNKEIIKEPIAAISIGIINGEELLDLTYKEDFQADVDSNLVMTQSGEIIEIQGTAEKKPFSKKQLNKMLSLGEKGIQELILMQKEILKIN
ncbi:MAG: ribonuclease PH, partial [Armatimonadetes bacterium]|nr:ribonuclease PH [Armatimonadota bacterium]